MDYIIQAEYLNRNYYSELNQQIVVILESINTELK